MSFDILTLTPFNVQLGGVDVGLNSSLPMPAPATFGGGSVTDGSDSSYVELGSRYNDSEGGERAELLLCDFAIDPTIHPEATWMHYSIRAKNDPTYLDSLSMYSLDGETTWYRADGGGDYIYRQRMPSALRNGTADSPTWFDQVYNGSPIAAGDPGDSTNWLNLPRDWPELLDPLTTTGLRFGMYVLSSASTRVPLIDVFEVRLVVACEATTGIRRAIVPPAAYVTPSLRMLQRGGSGGMAGIPRMVGNPTVRGSVRRGPSSVL